MLLQRENSETSTTSTSEVTTLYLCPLIKFERNASYSAPLKGGVFGSSAHISALLNAISSDIALVPLRYLKSMSAEVAEEWDSNSAS